MKPALERQVVKTILGVDGFMEGEGVFTDGPAWFVNGTQVANFRDEGLALRLTRKVISAERPRLKADERVILLRSGSDWIGIAVVSRIDLELVAELAELAAAAHRPPPGVAAKPAPTGTDLARRKRFH